MAHFGPPKIPKCLKNGLFWDQKWVKNGWGNVGASGSHPQAIWTCLCGKARCIAWRRGHPRFWRREACRVAQCSSTVFSQNQAREDRFREDQVVWLCRQLRSRAERAEAQRDRRQCVHDLVRQLRDRRHLGLFARVGGFVAHEPQGSGRARTGLLV